MPRRTRCERAYALILSRGSSAIRPEAFFHLPVKRRDTNSSERTTQSAHIAIQKPRAPISSFLPNRFSNSGERASSVSTKHRPTLIIIIEDIAAPITYFTSEVALSMAGVVNESG